MNRIVFGKLALLLTILGATGCHVCCNDCEVTGYCCPEIKKEKIVKEGWDVECKQICIPPIHCPCSNSCELKCGKVIAVRRLVKDKIECGEECVVKYKLVDPCAKPEPAEEHAKDNKKEPTPVEAPKPQAPASAKETKPSDQPEMPESESKTVEAAAMTPRSDWATRRAEFHAYYQNAPAK